MQTKELSRGRTTCQAGALAWVFCVACAGGGQLPASDVLPPADPATNQGVRFRQLASSATAIDGQGAALLPAVPDQDIFLKFEALLPAPAHDPARGGYSLQPPETWTVGLTETGEEVRVVFLEPEGGDMVVDCPERLELPREVRLVWLARYARRNLLLTAAGPAWALHVVPVAAQLIDTAGAPLFWVSSEASFAGPAAADPVASVPSPVPSAPVSASP